MSKITLIAFNLLVTLVLVWEHYDICEQACVPEKEYKTIAQKKSAIRSHQQHIIIAINDNQGPTYCLPYLTLF